MKNHINLNKAKFTCYFSNLSKGELDKIQLIKNDIALLLNGVMIVIYHNILKANIEIRKV